MDDLRDVWFVRDVPDESDRAESSHRSDSCGGGSYGIRARRSGRGGKARNRFFEFLSWVK